MTIDEAKKILTASRPGERDPDVPGLESALALARTDPELQAWWEREQAFDRALQSGLEEISPPEGLRERILEASEAEFSKDGKIAPETSKNRIPFFNWALPLAAAAAIVVAVFTLLPQPTGNPDTGDAALPELIAHLDQTLFQPDYIRLETRSNSLGELQAYLTGNQTPALRETPGNLIEMSPIGCMQVHFRGVKLGLICFEDGRRVFHVFSAAREDLPNILPDIRPENLPAVFETDDTRYKIWTDSQNVNILTHNGHKDEIETFF